METARKVSSMTIRVSSFFQCISIRGIPALARGRNRDCTRRWLHVEPASACCHAGVEHKRMFEAALEDISSRFKPDLIMISAGFDSHLGDPLGQLLLEDEDFVSLTKSVKQWAARLVRAASFLVWKVATTWKH